MSASMFGEPTHHCPKCAISLTFNGTPADPRCSQCGGPLVPIAPEPTALVHPQSAYEALNLNPND